jgi:hypothetical protein
LSGAGKRKVSDAVTTERTSTVRKHSRKFSPGAKCQNHLIATKSSRKSLFAVDENEHASNEDTTPTVPLFMNTFENTFLLILTCEIEECKSRTKHPSNAYAMFRGAGKLIIGGGGRYSYIHVHRL